MQLFLFSYLATAFVSRMLVVRAVTHVKLDILTFLAMMSLDVKVHVHL